MQATNERTWETVGAIVFVNSKDLEKAKWVMPEREYVTVSTTAKPHHGQH